MVGAFDGLGVAVGAVQLLELLVVVEGVCAAATLLDQLHFVGLNPLEAPGGVGHAL